jgi:prevent-host-death family protein
VDEIALRELRNDASAVLRRVEAGERFVVTVDRRPVAALVPLERRRSWVPAAEVWDRIRAHQADAALTAELDLLLEDRVDEE